MLTDSVADFINRLKNASAIGAQVTHVSHSKFIEAIAGKLQAAGFIVSFAKKTKKGVPTLEVVLAYDAQGNPKITHTERVSKPGRRMYSGFEHMFSVRGGKGALLVSTPKGVLTSEEARKEKVGGELLFTIW